ncbi:uncharacterized protein LOC132195968 isoform X2 [Neocloeon triangulifer]|uniref:uncharacterized protein LOC132195968 isoform X2 n=1 Tax=Neocloeon triangulifer TaxID=2078957 RepID=UPI00286F9EC5|nr:uncharacterized protein LOC132195968 isoform X2 [Neocloeon triangulifer]
MPATRIPCPVHGLDLEPQQDGNGRSGWGFWWTTTSTQSAPTQLEKQTRVARGGRGSGRQGVRKNSRKAALPRLDERRRGAVAKRPYPYNPQAKKAKPERPMVQGVDVLARLHEVKHYLPAESRALSWRELIRAMIWLLNNRLMEMQEVVASKQADYLQEYLVIRHPHLAGAVKPYVPPVNYVPTPKKELLPPARSQADLDRRYAQLVQQTATLQQQLNDLQAHRGAGSSGGYQTGPVQNSQSDEQLVDAILDLDSEEDSAMDPVEGTGGDYEDDEEPMVLDATARVQRLQIVELPAAPRVQQVSLPKPIRMPALGAPGPSSASGAVPKGGHRSGAYPKLMPRPKKTTSGRGRSGSTLSVRTPRAVPSTRPAGSGEKPKVTATPSKSATSGQQPRAENQPKAEDKSAEQPAPSSENQKKKE